MSNLYNHQLKVIDEDPKIAGLFYGTGTGKTRTALHLAQGSTLVICPKTQKEDKNWERENRKQGGLVKKLIVMSKEEFRRDHESLPNFDTVIIDEAHTCLGATPNVRWVKRKAIPKTSQLYEAVCTFIKRTKPSRLYLVTATIIRSPMTVWAAANILGKKWDWYKFRDEFYVRLPMPGRDVWQAKNDNISKNKLAVLVRKIGYVGRLQDFFDVPEQTFKTIHVDLTNEQKARIKDMKIEYPEPIVRVGKIHQIENGVLSGDEFSDPEFFDNKKIEKIMEIALEYPRMVIFAKYRYQISQIEARMKGEGHKVLTLTGDTKERGKVILEANEADECIFVAQAQISSGWELPEYPVVVFASRTYSFVDYDQALGRIQRANNIKKNLYIHLVVKGVDSAVDECLENKKDFNERIYLHI